MCKRNVCLMAANLPLENERVVSNNRCPTLLGLMQYARPGGSVHLITYASFAFRTPHFRPESDSPWDSCHPLATWDTRLNACTSTECHPLTLYLSTNRAAITVHTYYLCNMVEPRGSSVNHSTSRASGDADSAIRSYLPPRLLRSVQLSICLCL